MMGYGVSSGLNTGGGISFAWGDMFWYKQLIATAVFGALSLIFLGILCYKTSVRDCKTIATRNERGDYSRLKSVCFGDRYCATLFTRANSWIFECARSIPFVLLDAVKVKSRVFRIVGGAICIDHQYFYNNILGLGSGHVGLFDTRKQIYLHETIY